MGGTNIFINPTRSRYPAVAQETDPVPPGVAPPLSPAQAQAVAAPAAQPYKPPESWMPVGQVKPVANAHPDAMDDPYPIGVVVPHGMSKVDRIIEGLRTGSVNAYADVGGFVSGLGAAGTGFVDELIGGQLKALRGESARKAAIASVPVAAATQRYGDEMVDKAKFAERFTVPPPTPQQWVSGEVSTGDYVVHNIASALPEMGVVAAAATAGTVLTGGAGPSATIASYIVNSGSVYNSLRDRGVSPGKAAATAGIAGVPIAYLDAIYIKGLLKPGQVGNWAKRFADGFIKEAFPEAGQELAAAAAEWAAGVPDSLKDVLWRTFGAFTIGGTMGGIGKMTFHGAQRGSVEPQQTPPATPGETPPPPPPGAPPGGPGAPPPGAPPGAPPPGTAPPGGPTGGMPPGSETVGKVTPEPPEAMQQAAPVRQPPADAAALQPQAPTGPTVAQAAQAAALQPEGGYKVQGPDGTILGTFNTQAEAMAEAAKSSGGKLMTILGPSSPGAAPQAAAPYQRTPRNLFETDEEYAARMTAEGEPPGITALRNLLGTPAAPAAPAAPTALPGAPPAPSPNVIDEAAAARGRQAAAAAEKAAAAKAAAEAAKAEAARVTAEVQAAADPAAKRQAAMAARQARIAQAEAEQAALRAERKANADKGSSGSLYSNPTADPVYIARMVRAIAGDVARGVIHAGNFVEEIAKRFGENVRPMAPEVFERAQEAEGKIPTPRASGPVQTYWGNIDNGDWDPNETFLSEAEFERARARGNNEAVRDAYWKFAKRPGQSGSLYLNKAAMDIFSSILNDDAEGWHFDNTETKWIVEKLRDGAGIVGLDRASEAQVERLRRDVERHLKAGDKLSGIQLVLADEEVPVKGGVKSTAKEEKAHAAQAYVPLQRDAILTLMNLPTYQNGQAALRAMGYERKGGELGRRMDLEEITAKALVGNEVGLTLEQQLEVAETYSDALVAEHGVDALGIFRYLKAGEVRKRFYDAQARAEAKAEKGPSGTGGVEPGGGGELQSGAAGEGTGTPQGRRSKSRVSSQPAAVVGPGASGAKAGGGITFPADILQTTARVLFGKDYGSLSAKQKAEAQSALVGAIDRVGEEKAYASVRAAEAELPPPAAPAASAAKPKKETKAEADARVRAEYQKSRAEQQAQRQAPPAKPPEAEPLDLKQEAAEEEEDDAEYERQRMEERKAERLAEMKKRGAAATPAAPSAPTAAPAALTPEAKEAKLRDALRRKWNAVPPWYTQLLGGGPRPAWSDIVERYIATQPGGDDTIQKIAETTIKMFRKGQDIAPAAPTVTPEEKAASVEEDKVIEAHGPTPVAVVQSTEAGTAPLVFESIVPALARENPLISFGLDTESAGLLGASLGRAVATARSSDVARARITLAGVEARERGYDGKEVADAAIAMVGQMYPDLSVAEAKAAVQPLVGSVDRGVELGAEEIAKRAGGLTLGQALLEAEQDRKNPYQARARAKKAEAIADLLHRSGITSADIPQITQDQWKTVVEKAGSKFDPKVGFEGETLDLTTRLLEGKEKSASKATAEGDFSEGTFYAGVSPIPLIRMGRRWLKRRKMLKSLQPRSAAAVMATGAAIRKRYQTIEQFADQMPDYPAIQTVREIKNLINTTANYFKMRGEEVLDSWRTLSGKEKIGLVKFSIEAHDASRPLGRKLTLAEEAALPTQINAKQKRVYDETQTFLQDSIRALEGAVQRRIAQQSAASGTSPTGVQLQTAQNENFFPSIGFGSYLVYNQTTGDVTRHDTREEQETKVEELEGLGQVGVKSGLSKQEMAFSGMPYKMVQDLMTSLSIPADSKSKILDVAVRDSSHRVTAYDGERAIAQFAQKMGNYIAKAQYRTRLEAANAEASAYTENLVNMGQDGTNAVAMQDWIRESVQHILNPVSSFSWLKSLLFMKFFAFVPRQAAVNMTQLTNSFAALAAMMGKGSKIPGYGQARAAAIMVKAMTDVREMFRAGQPSMAADERMLFNTLMMEGLLDKTYAASVGAMSHGSPIERAIAGVGLPRESARTGAHFVRWFNEWGVRLFAIAEEFLRRFTALSAYRGAKEIGDPNPIGRARKMVNVTQGSYDLNNIPPAFRGNKSVLYVFRAYLQNQLNFYRYEDGGIQAMMMMTFFSGLMGLPFAGLFADLADLILTKYREKMDLPNPKVDVRQAMREYFGKISSGVADVILNGVSRRLPWDISGSTSTGDIVPSEGWTKGVIGSMEPERAVGRTAEEIGGVGVSQFMRTGRNVFEMDKDKLIRGLSPEVINNIRDVYGAIHKEAWTTTDGKPLVPLNLRDSWSQAELFGKLLGFNPSSRSIELDAKYVHNEEIMYYDTHRELVLNSILAALTSGEIQANGRPGPPDRKLVKAATDAYVNFNKKAPNEFKWTRDQLDNAIAQRMKNRELGMRGIPTREEYFEHVQKIRKSYGLETPGPVGHPAATPPGAGAQPLRP